jgi:HSP90 family molecular chaperone
VSERVEVITKSEESEKAYVWSSTGKGEYSISEINEELPFERGTNVIL